MSRKFIYSVAMPFAMMFAAFLTNALVACSDDKSVAGGASEETRGLASLENITVAGRALNLYVKTQEVGPDDEESVVVISGSAYAEGARVKFFGVDTATFEISEEPFAQAQSDNDGNFEVKDVSPESPFAVVEVTGNIALNVKNPGGMLSYYPDDSLAETTYRTVVDLRKIKDVKVNILTTLATDRVFNLAKSGLTFAEAKDSAETDVLHALGIRETLDAFDKVDYSKKTSSIFPVFIMTSYLFEGSLAAVDLAAADIAEDGNWRALTYERYLDQKHAEMMSHLLREPEFLVLLGLDSTDTLVAELAEKYFFNVVIKIAYRKGDCTESRQGESFDHGYYVYVVCEDDYWRVREKELQKNLGTMTDERDGKEYKTFSFTYKDTTWTWFAENLNYAVDNSWCYDDDPANCETYGRLYSMWATYNVPRDTAYIATEWACLYAKRQQADDDYEQPKVCKDYEEAKDRVFEALDSADVQGVCPEGWHIPTPDDWANLIDYAFDEIGYFDDVYAAFKTTTWTAGSDGKDAFGFNMLPAGRADRRDVPEWYKLEGSDDDRNPLDVAGDSGLGQGGCYFAWGEGRMHPFNIKDHTRSRYRPPYCVNPTDDSGDIVKYTGFEYGHSVRCVKD